MAGSRICVGAIAGAHGVRGQVRITTFTADPDDLTAYGPVGDEDGGRHFEIAAVGRSRGQMIARIAGIGDRDAAEALKGTRLYVDRAALPATGADEFYHADLIGLAVVDLQGKAIGTIRGVFDFGAGDVLEVVPEDGPSQMVRFTREAVPEVDLKGGKVVVELPPEAPAGGGGEDEEEDGRTE